MRHSITQEEIDRLVDGELSPDSRRALLGKVDQIEDGWKDVATAFLVAQAWRDELGRLASADREPEPAAPRSAGGNWRRAVRQVALAASWLVALCIGYQSANHRDSKRPDQGIASTVTPRRLTDEPASVVPNKSVATPDLAPVYVSSEDDLVRWWNDTTRMPHEFKDRLLRSGVHVQRDFRLFPVELQDGRRGLIPIEELELVPISASEIQ